jgi:hypothetical protein
MDWKARKSSAAALSGAVLKSPLVEKGLLKKSV